MTGRVPWFPAPGDYDRVALADHDYTYLCCACGEITPEEHWSYWARDDEGKLVPNPPGEEPAVSTCPACRWEHVDDDSNPGIYDGTLAENEKQRAELSADPVWADFWKEAR